MAENHTHADHHASHAHVPIFTVNLYVLLIVLLSLIVVVLGVKYVHLRIAQRFYTNQTIMQNIMLRPHESTSIVDYGKIIADAVQAYSPQSTALSGYVEKLSKDLGRDIVVVDTNKKILADSIPANVGTAYVYDSSKEVTQTLQDGAVRVFVEKSVDYPQGIWETVVPVRTTQGTIVGAVLISSLL